LDRTRIAVLLSCRGIPGAHRTSVSTREHKWTKLKKPLFVKARVTDHRSLLENEGVLATGGRVLDIVDRFEALGSTAEAP